MRYFKAIRAGAGLSALMVGMIGCDSADRIQDPSAASGPVIGAVGVKDSSEFDRELIRAKTANTDPALQDRAIQAVFDKYGVAYPRAAGLEGPVSGETLPVGPERGAAAAKAAFTSFTALRRQFSANATDIRTFSRTVTVKKGESLGAAALANAANVDPFLVAFYSDPFITPKLSQLKVVAYNDEAGTANRNAVIQWTNNTGADRSVTVVAFAYSTLSRGLGNVLVNTTSSSSMSVDQPIGGLKQFGATALPSIPNHCTFAYTRLSHWENSDHLESEGSASLVVDTRVMRGAQVRHVSTSLDMSWQVNNPYPSFALIYNTSPKRSATVQLTQKDFYTCVE